MIVNENDKIRDNFMIAGWESVISEAKAGIRKAKARIRQLENSIRISEQKLKDGEPWPGSSTQG